MGGARSPIHFSGTAGVSPARVSDVGRRKDAGETPAHPGILRRTGRERSPENPGLREEDDMAAVAPVFMALATGRTR